MKIESPSFTSGGSIPVKYTCEGDNISPELRIADVPQEAKSLVLIVDDPDAPRRTFVHWTIWNIRPETSVILEGSVPLDSIEGITDFGKIGYGGPCPPSGKHRYYFRLSALDTKLDLPSSSNVDILRRFMKGHILAEAELMGLFQKTNN